jgi:hypothetical protein
MCTCWHDCLCYYLGSSLVRLPILCSIKTLCIYICANILSVTVVFFVSGCDGVTYGSECNADAARVDIKHKGECKEEVRVTPCPANYAPVCGCDGTTYANECMAEASDAEVCFEGECPAEPAIACPMIFAPVW